MEKIDLVYILGKGSRWQNNEIRYSLRSVEKNFPNCGQVFVVGEKPKWIQNIIHIPAEDCYGHKLKNAIGKIRKASLDKRISDNFLLMNDDFLFLKKTRSVPVYHRETLSEYIKHHETQGGYYFHANVDTLQLLEMSGIGEPLSFEVHCPIPFNKKKVATLTASVNWKETGYLLRSLYYNIYAEPSEEMEDCKVYQIGDLEKLKHGWMISTCDRVVLNSRFQKWVKSRFPNQSRFEIAD